jgi:hypothetical protein
MFETIIVVCWIKSGISVCDTKYPSEYSSSSSCWSNYNSEKNELKNIYKLKKNSTTIAYGGCFKK